MIYNNANALYEASEYSEAQEQYERIGECLSWTFCQQFYHNLGNTLYRLGEKETDEQKVLLRQEAIATYDQALSIENNEQTQFNRDFVADKLQDAEQEEQEDSSEQNDQEKQQDDESEWEDKQNNEWEDNTTEDNVQQWEQQENWSTEEESTWLSDYQRAQLEQYVDILEQQQLTDQVYFNKQSPENTNPFKKDR